jgi:3-hydroxy-D-aspartate aldolase
MALDEIETPALLIDLDAYERNLDRMTQSLEGKSLRLRPHAKTHKCPTIALHQMERGAVGICCQTLGEAEVMAANGVPDILITNQVVSPKKIRRLAELAAKANVAVCADNESNVADLARAAFELGIRLPVLIEVDIGQHRCGVEPGDSAVALAQAVADRPSLRFSGMHAYHGGAQHVYSSPERSEVMRRAIALAGETADRIRSRGLPVDRITGGGTGTYLPEADSGVYDEVQPGSYIFMDADYGRVDGAPRVFEHSLSVLTTVLSTSKGRCVCDAGLKASSTDSGLPVVLERPGLAYVGASDEHGTISVGDGAAGPRVGEKIRLIPGHCDPTVNLHDWFVAVRGERVEAIWPILARGANT